MAARVSTLRAQITRGRERRPLYSVLTLTLSLSPLRYCCFVPVVPPSSSSSSSSSRVWLQYPRRQERGQLTSGTGKQRPPDSRCWIFSPSLHAVATCHTSLRSGYFIIPPRFQAGRMSSESIRDTSWKRLPMNCVSILWQGTTSSTPHVGGMMWCVLSCQVH